MSSPTGFSLVTPFRASHSFYVCAKLLKQALNLISSQTLIRGEYSHTDSHFLGSSPLYHPNLILYIIDLGAPKISVLNLFWLRAPLKTWGNLCFSQKNIHANKTLYNLPISCNISIASTPSVILHKDPYLQDTWFIPKTMICYEKKTNQNTHSEQTSVYYLTSLIRPASK